MTKMNTLALVFLIILFGISCQNTRVEKPGIINPDTAGAEEKASTIILKEPVQVIAEYSPMVVPGELIDARWKEYEILLPEMQH
jgi:hypothetical protein